MSETGPGKNSLNLAAVRARLARSGGRRYWRGLEELAESEEFHDFLHNEFPAFSSRFAPGIDRRELLKLLGASLALAGFSACAEKTPDKIVPYVREPEEFVPGQMLYYATAMPFSGYGLGLLVESHLGRPTKVEGNPQHPASLGATNAQAQASVLTLYDPDRSQAVSRNGRISSWVTFVGAVNGIREVQRIKKGAGLRLLTETITSPSLFSQIQAVLQEFPLSKWYQYEPVCGDGARQGSRLAFGDYANTVYRVDKADVILSLDSNFLCDGPGSLRYSRDWAARRQGSSGPRGMNRLYAVESTPTNTGAVADHRLVMRASEIENFAGSMARELGIAVPPSASPPHSEWMAAVVRDLKARPGAGLIVPGDYQSPQVHALAHVMNGVLGNTGSTVFHTNPVEAGPVDQLQSLRALVDEMKSGAVEVLVVMGGNPVYNSPADLGFADALRRVQTRIHAGLYADETSLLCHWHIPEAHFLESWGDTRAFDGTVSIIQPLISPLYAGKSGHELLSTLLGNSGVSGYRIVHDYWKGKYQGTDFESAWQRSVHDGLVANSALPEKSVTPRTDWLAQAPGQRPQPRGTEIIFRPDPTIFDGRFANNGWLQELPRPLTRLTWDNAVLMSPRMAEQLSLYSENLVEVDFRGKVARAPVWVMPGHPDDSITVHLGYGRTQAGRVGSGVGFNAYQLRPSDALWTGIGVQLRKAGGQGILAATQLHHSMEGRELVRVGTLAEYEKNPRFAQDQKNAPGPDETLYPAYDYSKGNQWGMMINLSSCTGCAACVVACQAENNIPIVGKTEVTRGREMHWLRVDRYYEGNIDSPLTVFQPVPCMHCENAPCELVCPVQATSHSGDGLNQMVYNRCVGTRYCSNNCPYKVRRFNFVQYSDWNTPSLKGVHNPDVTVRGRGVMEKCTYCVQRINRSRIRAEEENREIRDGEVVTACQQACPTSAIVFGDINDKESRMSRLRSTPLKYDLLGELNTRPRTSYAAKLRNPDPDLDK